MFRLRTFGTFGLTDPAGGNTALPPHRLALLALVAAAGDRGIARDKLLAYLWPDSTPVKARASLEQMLHALRTSLGDRSALLGNPVRLEPSTASSDVAEFRRMIDDGDLERAVALYAGPFLDGFYLSGIPEFEQWLTAERSRLEAQYVSAIEKLAVQAAARREHARAIEWIQALGTVTLPTPAATRRFIEALVASGDRDAALEYVVLYSDRVRAELEGELDPSIAALAQELRRNTSAPELEPVILKALARSQGDRWKGAAEFLEEPRRHTSGAQTAVPRPVWEPAPVSRRRRLPGMTVAAALVLGVALAAFALSGRFSGAPVTGAGDAAGEFSVAVLHFDNLSPDSANAWLAGSLTEEIISRLGGVARLQVKRPSREAVRRMRDSLVDYVVAVGKALSVRYLVEGSVSSEGGRVKVRAALVRSSDGFRVWSDQYEATALVLQSEIANSVAAGITGLLTPGEHQLLTTLPTQSAAAYDRLLEGNYFYSLRDQGFDRALNKYEDALRLDPAFSRAFARMALTYGTCGSWRFRCLGLGRDSLLALGFAAADRALEVDSSTADAWLALGILRLEQDPLKLSGAREAMERALRLEPRNPEAHHLLGFVLGLAGQDSAASAEFHAALSLDPYRIQTLRHLTSLKGLEGRPDEALRMIDSAVNISPTPSGELHEVRSSVKRRLGDFAGARVDAEAAVRLQFGYPVELALLDAQAGDTVSARARVERLRRDIMNSGRSRDWSHGISLGKGYIALGDLERALQALEHVQPPSAAFWFSLRSPDFEHIRNNPRFRKLVAATRPRQ